MPSPPYPKAAQANPAETLAGLVERVTYHNEESGFCVLRVKGRRRDLITIVSRAASISAGEWVQRSRTWANDRTHGLQYRATLLKATPPTTLGGIEKHLGSGMSRGIGLTHDPAASRKPSNPPATTPKAAYSASRNASSGSTMMYYQECRP
jgi:exodeoxyribonuclease V alpha subunit